MLWVPKVDPNFRLPLKPFGRSIFSQTDMLQLPLVQLEGGDGVAVGASKADHRRPSS
jgi:hypothetical protein